MNWYYAKDKEQLGPIDEATLKGLAQSGTITPDTLVWQEGMAAWTPYSQVMSGAPLAAPTTEGVCVECGRAFEKSDMIQHSGSWICASCKPLYLQKLREGAEIPVTGLRYAGFWIRFLAKFVDGLILTILLVVPFIAIMAAMGGFSATEEKPSNEAIIFQIAFQAFYYVVMAIYSIYFVGKFGATPGKMACKIQIVDASGAKIGYGRATGRFFAEILSGLICYIGYLMVAFDSEKRALHDRICNTRVVYK